MRSLQSALLTLLLVTYTFSSPNRTVSIPQNTQTPTASPPPTDPGVVVDVNTAKVQIGRDEDVDVYLIVPVNKKGILECTSDNFRDNSLKWLKNGEVLSSSVDGIRNVIYEVDGSSETNAGLYTCLTNSESRRTVKVFIEEQSDAVLAETEQRSTNRGENLELRPPLNVWPANLLDFQLIFIRAPDEGAVQIASFPEQDLSDDVTVSDISNSLIYVIPDTQPQNHGMYKFILKYGDRNLVHQYFVTVTYKPEIVSFQQLPEFVSLYDDVIMTVNVSGFPAPSITWWHVPCCPEQEPINIKELIKQDASELKYYHLLNDESLLNLKGGTRRFNGSYWFAAENELGSIQSPPTYYKLKGYNITVESGTNSNVSSLVQYENHGTLELTCVVERDEKSVSELKIVWYHNGEEVSNTTNKTGQLEARQTLRVEAPSLAAAGRYSCIATSNLHTLWSYPVDVTVVKQPITSVSPAVYQAEVGATVIFSCIVDNIDGVRGEDWGVVYKVKEQNQEYKDVPVSLPAESNEEGLLYVSDLETEPEVRCLTSPSLHVQPVFRDARVLHVQQPPASVKVISNKQRYSEGETLIIRCVIDHIRLDGATVEIFWKHGDVTISTVGGAGTLDDGRVAERYFTSNSENQTTEVLFIEELTRESSGSYTCVFNGGEMGRYEDSYHITVHPATPINTIAIILAVCFVLILVITMGVVLALIIQRSKTFSYSVADKQGSPTMNKIAL